jgi:hypothetical protein
MPMPGIPDPLEDVKIHWVEIKSTQGYGADEVLREERGKRSAERAEVFAIDLQTTAVESALEWAEHFRAGLSPKDPPACLVAYGRDIKPEDQEQFALAGVHAIDVFRNDLDLHGPSQTMLVNLVRSVVMTRPVFATNPGPSQPGPSSGDWQLYSSSPSHVPSSTLTGLFEELARDDRPWWERDS